MSDNEGKDCASARTEDLAELEKSLASEMFQNRFKNFTNRLDDTSSIRKTQRDLARVKPSCRARRGITVDEPSRADAKPRAEAAKAGQWRSTDAARRRETEAPRPKAAKPKLPRPKAAKAAPKRRRRSQGATEESK